MSTATPKMDHLHRRLEQDRTLHLQLIKDARDRGDYRAVDIHDAAVRAIERAEHYLAEALAE